MASQTQSTDQHRLVTVNRVPERAKRLIAVVIENLRHTHDIVHVANCEKIDDVQATVINENANVLFVASMWLPEESERIQSTAKTANQDIVTYALPHGLQAEKGPEAIVSHLVEVIPRLLPPRNI